MTVPLRRSLVCYWAVKELGMTDAEIENLLGLTQPAVSRVGLHEEKLALDNKFRLVDKMKVIFS
jgi:predicted transcriptional regulator